MLQNNVINVLMLLLHVLSSKTKKIDDEKHKTVRIFPSGFLFGASTAAYQIEGAWNVDGKSSNIWDNLTHKYPYATDDIQNADITDDSYNKYKRDVEMMRELGLDVYRFSISWTRILPKAFANEINQAGIDYYNNLINELLKYNIQPVITLYHWDLPQKLQDLGGWANPYIADWFADFSRVAFESFGDRVKYWITINEPREICYAGYGEYLMAPRVDIKGYAEYVCAKNLLLAHAKAYDLYDKDFRAMQGGVVGITIGAAWYAPETDGYAKYADDLAQFEWGQYAHPIFSEEGDWPLVMKKKISAKSKAQGFKRSRLPEFTPEEVALIQGSADFFGLNHYSTNMVYKNGSLLGMYEIPSYNDDINVGRYQPNDWKGGASFWLKDVPLGFYKQLTYIRKTYDNPIILITENGYSTFGGLEDDNRISYLRGYLNAMLDAIEEGSDIRMYFHWSLMDNFEWRRGYTERFGLYEVDYESPERTRTPRKSAFVYKEIVRSRQLDFTYEPDTTFMTIDKGN